MRGLSKTSVIELLLESLKECVIHSKLHFHHESVLIYNQGRISGLLTSLRFLCSDKKFLEIEKMIEELKGGKP